MPEEQYALFEQLPPPLLALYWPSTQLEHEVPTVQRPPLESWPAGHDFLFAQLPVPVLALYWPSRQLVHEPYEVAPPLEYWPLGHDFLFTQLAVPE
jgi:hypothetical protein